VDSELDAIDDLLQSILSDSVVISLYGPSVEKFWDRELFGSYPYQVKDSQFTCAEGIVYRVQIIEKDNDWVMCRDICGLITDNCWSV